MTAQAEFFSTLLNASEQEALDALSFSGYEGIVTCHEPSRLRPDGNLHLITLEEARKHTESEQDILLLFPPRYLMLSFCQYFTSDQKKIRIVQETTSYTSMVETVVKALEFLGDKDKHIYIYIYILYKEFYQKSGEKVV